MVYTRKPKIFFPKFEVVSCFCEYEDTILLLQQREGKFQGGLWGVPAGKVDEEEFLVDAMIRELYEETKIQLSSEKLFFLNTVYVRYDEFDFIYHMYKAFFREKPKVYIHKKEHTDYEWLTPGDALQKDLIKDEDSCIRMWYA